MVPLPAAHLLSNHYNLTRDQYYRELAEASNRGRTDGFVAYATQGFLDGIRDQIGQVRKLQLEVTWINFVHQMMDRYPSSPARDRQRTLVLAMPPDQAIHETNCQCSLPQLQGSMRPRGLARSAGTSTGCATRV